MEDHSITVGRCRDVKDSQWTTIDSVPDRSTFGAREVVQSIWQSLKLPNDALESLDVPGDGSPALPSSFKVGIWAQSTIALSALAAGLVYAHRNRKSKLPRVEVKQQAAAIEFKSERLFEIRGWRLPPRVGPLGGLYETADGHIRLHDSFAHHMRGTLELLGLHAERATVEDVQREVRRWKCIDLETVSVVERGLVNYAVRTYQEWDLLPQSKAISNDPILLRQLAPGPKKALPTPSSLKCLKGLRVVEMSRVIAAPVAGMTLAAHGADVLWVTSPNLPALPRNDRNFGRGKRSVQLDLNIASEKARLWSLLATCDVFIQGYRPGSLAAQGFTEEALAAANPSIICANLSAFGPDGPWSGRRGFDSLVQTCSGMNVSEAEHAGKGEAARPMPCQALDHSGGYLLATGIMAALHHRSVSGGSWRVDVSLAGNMKYLRSLGQYPGATGFDAPDYTCPGDVPEEFFDSERETDFGVLKAIKHAPVIDGCEVGWDVMPRALGSDTPEWLRDSDT